MGSANIQAKIQKGLKKAIAAVGSKNSNLIYLIVETVTGGDTPLSPTSTTEKKVLLPNALFQSLDANLFDSDIISTDKQLVSDNTVVIERGNIIEQGSNRYIIVNQSIKAPTSDVLAYISQLRAQ